MNQHHTPPPPRTPPAGLGHPCGNRLANSHNSFRFERRFNLKVFKAIHHTYQWETNGPGSATSLRLQPDMSAAICCAIAEAHSTSLPPTHRLRMSSPFLGSPSPRGALYWPVTREQFDVSDAPSTAVDPYTALRFPGWQRTNAAKEQRSWSGRISGGSVAFDFQHFWAIVSPRREREVKQEQKAEQTPEHKNDRIGKGMFKNAGIAKREGE